MDKTILLLSAPWLGVQDVMSLRCVCKEWHSALESNEDGAKNLWKQILMNTYGEAVVGPLVACFDAQSGSENYFLHVAQCLGHAVAVPEQPTYRPASLNPKDILIVVEICRTVNENGTKRRLVLGSVCVQDATCMFKEKTFFEVPKGSMNVQGANAFHSETPPVLTTSEQCQNEFLSDWRTKRCHGPVDYACADALGIGNDKIILRARVILIRRDTMQSVCVMDGPVFDVRMDDPSFDDTTPRFFDTDATIAFAQSDEAAGANALNMMKCKGYANLRMEVHGDLNAVLPDPGTHDGYSWLEAMYHGPRNYVKNSEHDKELAQIPYFTFEFQKLYVNFNIEKTYRNFASYGEQFDSLNDMMVAIEGFSWR